MTNSRPTIPAAIRRAVRQKCRFGCVICGLPIYDYDHIVDYSIVKEHTEDNIYLACPNHHRLKGNKAIPVEVIKEKIQTLNRAYTTPSDLYFKKLTLILGNNRIINFGGTLFDFMGRNFMALKLGDSLSINAVFRDHIGNKIMIIKDSEYRLWTDVWDIEWIKQGETLIFRHKLGDVFLKVSFFTSTQTVRLLGKFYLNGDEYLNITEDGIFINDFLLASECVAAVSNVGFVVNSVKRLYSCPLANIKHPNT